MTRYPLYRRLGGLQGRSGRVRKISPPTGIRSPDRPARIESLYRLSHPGPLHNNEEVETIVREWLRMRELPEFYREGIFKDVPRWGA